MDAIHLADARGLPLSHTAWTQVREVIDWVCENWDRPEEGIWETRGGQQSFTYGRLMCWVALDRAIGLAGDQLGNFPQAFSHLALINAAAGVR